MNLDPRIDLLASALADRSRSLIVLALMDGRAYTAKELAYRARVSAQTASFHLQRLVDAGVTERYRQGRNRFYFLAGPDIAAAVEALTVAAPTDHLRRHRTRAGEELLLARSCYDHLAGGLGVAVADKLAEVGAILSRGGDFMFTPAGRRFLQGIGVDAEGLDTGRRPAAKRCLDWTERRFHIAGALGTALFDHFLCEGWLERVKDSRALRVTPQGRALFRSKMGIDTENLGSGSFLDGGATAGEHGQGRTAG